MDIEIVKNDGTSYFLESYDIIVKDVIVESMETKDTYQDYESLHGRYLLNSVYLKRKIHVPVFFESDNNVDYALQRSLLYELVQDNKPFYLREMRRYEKVSYDFRNTTSDDYQPIDERGKPMNETEDQYNNFVTAKKYLVKLTNVLSPEQKNFKGSVTLEFETVGLPFAESIGTSLELHKQTISDSWSADMDIDLEDTSKQKYIFENVSSGNVYYHGTVPNNQHNMYKVVRIIIGQNTNNFSWTLGTGNVMTLKGLNLKSGDVIVYDGLKIMKNSQSVVKYSNIEMPALNPGFNKFQFNQKIKKVEFDVKFYSK